jgi:hypothetical protein
MRVGSLEELDGRDGLVFLFKSLATAASVKNFEQNVGRLLPDKCDDIFDGRGPFLLERGGIRVAMVFLFRKDFYDVEIIRTLGVWRLNHNSEWVEDYFADHCGEDEEECNTPPTQELLYE